MRKIIVKNMVSVDGYFALSDGNIDWHNVDDEFNKFSIEVLSNVDTILFGRVTYDLFESYWPKALSDPKTSEDDRKIAQAINDIHKMVFSASGKELTWNNSAVFRTIDEDQIHDLKEQDGKDIIIYGSGTVVQQLTDMGLIDEYHLMVNPIILGMGKALFDEVNTLKLELMSDRTFNNGNVLLSYRPA